MSRARLLPIAVVFLAGLVLIFGFAAGCRRPVPHLDDVTKIAYGVKPAVVRISAFATADFHYPSDTVARVEAQLLADGHDIRARNVPPSAAEVKVETGAGGSGSGFIIHPDGYILTNGHVVAPTRDMRTLGDDLQRNGAIAALIRHFSKEKLRTLSRDELERYIAPFTAGRIENVRVVNQVELSNGETLPFRIRHYSPSLRERGTDLAVLQIERKGLPSLALADSDATRVGDAIWSVGYPDVASSSDEVIGGWLSSDSDLEPTFSVGMITAIKRNVANAPVFQSNVGIYPGNSGGPAVNHDGEVVAVSTWGHTNAEQIKFLVPINVARQMLAEGKISASTEGEFNLHYRAALEAASVGKWIVVKSDLERASQLFPKSPDLIRFSRDADRGIASMSFSRLHPVLTGFVATLLLAVIAVAMTFLLRSRATRIPADLLKSPTVETVVAPTGASSSPHSLLGKFTILNGTRAGEKLGLGGSGIRIGRESTICEIVLENPKVSRLHAEVVSIDGKVLLIDRNSSNGTYVNDQKIDKRYLQDGDIIYFGGRNAVAMAFHA
jgi:S1-C subfamily serine protease